MVTIFTINKKKKNKSQNNNFGLTFKKKAFKNNLIIFTFKYVFTD